MNLHFFFFFHPCSIFLPPIPSKILDSSKQKQKKKAITFLNIGTMSELLKSHSITDAINDSIVTLVRRHEGHSHYANVKYGYLMLALSFIFVFLLSFKAVFFKKFSAKHNLLPITVAVWALAIASLCIIHVHFEVKTLAKRAGRYVYRMRHLVFQTH